MPSAAPADPTVGGVGQRRGVLLYGMYDITGLGSAPKVRIAKMAEALAAETHVETITGGRFRRVGRAARWLLSGGPRRVSAVYVESATTSAMPTDLAFLALMRLLRRPIGIYFRDAYQLFRDIYPRHGRRQWFSDMAWQVSMPLLARLATCRFVASAGLASAMRLRDAVVLGPGTDPTMPDLGAGPEPLVGYVGAYSDQDGFDRLLAAMEIVHAALPAAQLIHVGPELPPDRARALPEYVTSARAGRNGLPEQLALCRVCVIPRPLNAYTDLAQPVKLWDYLSMGKPVVSTRATETAAVLLESQAGLITDDTPQAIADGLLMVLRDPGLADRLATHARVFATSPAATWSARARLVAETLGAV